MKIKASKRLIVKIGSRLLIDENQQKLNIPWLESLLDDLSDFIKQGIQIIIVSSGAVAYGNLILQFDHHRLTLDAQQASSAVGQIQLIHTFQTLLAQRGLIAAQVLLTLHDIEDRRRFINCRNSIERLLRMQVVPIINENDCVGTAELRYGDNDRLAARTAQMTDADTLVLLSDIDGLYDQDPTFNTQANFIPTVHKITPEIEAMAGESATCYGSGGMITKLAAAKITMQSGCRLLITRGTIMNPLRHYEEQGHGTWFLPETTSLNAKKRWLKQHVKPAGTLLIDHGAAKALLSGKSLLPVGILTVKGHFNKGEVIRIVNPDQQEIARGLTNYSVRDIEKIIGTSSDQIEVRLGYRGCHEVIYRNNLVVYTRRD